MIGMDTIKKTIVDQILYYLQELHVPVGQPAPAPAPAPPAPAPPVLNPFTEPLFDFKTLNQRISENIKKKMSECGGGGGGDPINSADFAAPTKGDFMHTVICGPPGSGKTEVAKIIGRIFSNLGILTKKTFKKVSRNDLVAGYLGQTAIKTKDIIKASIGGVLFIDEAYSLGNSEKRDSFAKECVDTLCEALSEHKHNWMVIIAGYEKELNDCFFSLNEGLNSRFTWRFKLDNYKPGELKSIYEKQVRDFGWTIAAAAAVSDKHGHGHGLRDEWFAEHMDYFTSYGRDMETLFTKTKIAHSRRVFCLPLSAKTEITMTDLENGFKLFIENPEVKERANNHGGSYMKTLYL
jgi:nicotinamide riboside kinase